MSRINRTQLLIVVGLTALAVAFVAFALLRPEPPTFEPGDVAVADSAGAMRITVNATHPDEWRFVSFEQGAIVDADAPWDLAVRRFHLITNGGPGFEGDAGALEIGHVPFEAVDALPADDFVPSSADSTHRVLDRWYRYGFTSHLLTPRETVFAIRTSAGRVVKLQIRGYYCPGPIAGCVTLRYAFIDAH